jgi:signal transduction histidine kinase
LDYVYEPVGPALAVSADREKLQQILLNLLSNAIKYTPSRGTIRASVETDGDEVLFHVSDTGRGIPAEKCDQIFAPFVRVDTGYSRATEGTGLGLAISRDLARTMRGDLTVRSVLGEGSTFTLRLPRGG